MANTARLAFSCSSSSVSSDEPQVIDRPDAAAAAADKAGSVGRTAANLDAKAADAGCHEDDQEATEPAFDDNGTERAVAEGDDKGAEVGAAEGVRPSLPGGEAEGQQVTHNDPALQSTPFNPVPTAQTDEGQETKPASNDVVLRLLEMCVPMVCRCHRER